MIDHGFTTHDSDGPARSATILTRAGIIANKGMTSVDAFPAAYCIIIFRDDQSPEVHYPEDASTLRQIYHAQMPRRVRIMGAPGEDAALELLREFLAAASLAAH